MDKRQSTGGVLGTGGLLMGLIQTMHPEWLGNRPWILPLAIVLFSLSVFIFVAQYRWFQRLIGIEPSAQPAGMTERRNAKTKTGGDVTGSIYTAAGDINFLPFTPKHSEPAPIEEKGWPILEIRSIGINKFIWHPGIGEWQIAQEHELMGRVFDGIFVRIDNPRPVIRGMTGIPCDSIYASLTFSCENTLHRIVIDRAYWVGEHANRTNIDPSSSKQVFVGFVKDCVLHASENKNKYGRPDHPFGHKSHNRPDSKTMNINGNVLLELAILDSQSHTLIGQNSFIISCNEEGIFGVREL